MNNNVIVAYSGGIDSTFCIIKLKKIGYNVTAIHFVHNGINNITRCEKMCNYLNIPLQIIDVSHMFDKVFEHINNELLNLRMPNPCVYCNKIIKFDFLIKHALDNGFKYIATGHYAQIHTLNDGKKTIMKSIDKSKDQSYFLNQVNQNMLQYILFPLGDMLKSDIYSYMNIHNIELPQNGESYDLCFTGNKNFQEFCKSKFNVDIEGIITDGNEEIMTINNAELVCINQRIPIKGKNKRFYVTNKKMIDSNKCEITINQHMNNNISEIHVDNVNYFIDDIPNKLEFITRYHTQPISGHFDKINKIIHFDAPIINSGPGQYIVAYYNNYIIFGCKII